MAKMNLNMQISERDKKLLMMLFIVGIVFCAYFFGYRRFTALNEQYEKEIAQLTKTKKELVRKNANKQKYIDDTAMYKEEYTKILGKYVNGSTQDASIDFVNKLELLTGAWIKSVSFSEKQPLYTFGRSSRYETDLIGYRTELTLSYEASYEELKEMISFINEYPYKNTIESIVMGYSDVAEIVSGSLTIMLYSVEGSDREFTHPEFDIETGKDIIFEFNN